MPDNETPVTDGNASLGSADDILTALQASSGQESDSPPDEGQQSDSPAGEDTGLDEQDAEQDDEVDDDTTPETTAKAKTDEGKPLPYDQDPKWKAARAAQKQLEGILDDNGYDSVEELLQDLRDGRNIKDLIGDRDAQEVIKKAQTLEEYELYWAQQEHERKKAEETPEETIARLEAEREERTKASKKTAEQETAEQDTAKAVELYEQEISKAVESTEGFNETEKTLAKTLFGLDNPAITVDITDKAAVRKMAKAQLPEIRKMLDTIRQDAIDAYATGKTKIKPSKPPASSDSSTTSVQPKPLPEKDFYTTKDVEEAFAAGNSELLELLTAQAR